MKQLPFVGTARHRLAATPDARWLDHLSVWQPDDPDQLVTGAHEVLVLLLGGTFDLVGGGTAWPARGARPDPFGGRPMAVFLPPNTPFRVGNGRGSILMVAARQPDLSSEPSGKQVLAQKPLLPLAGSGKAFDPNSGEWRPAETFPTAPESLPPRRFERIPIGELVLERVFAPDYKAATLALDELVLPAGGSLRLGDVPGHGHADELLVFVRAEAAARIGEHTLAAGDHALHGRLEEFATTCIDAVGGRVYLALAYAGKAQQR